MSLQSWRDQIEQAETNYNATDARLTGHVREAGKVRTNANGAKQALETAQEIAEQLQGKAHAQIAAVVNRCLQAVFDEPYEFKIEFIKRRNKTEAELMFYRGEHPVRPLTESGGGVADIASFALRVAALSLARPRARRVLIMDEPFRFVSATLRPRLRAMMESLSEDMGFQFIQVTHIPELAIGKIVDLS